MKYGLMSAGFSLAASDQMVTDLETNCRKIHSDTAVESLAIAFFVSCVRFFRINHWWPETQDKPILAA